MTQQEQAWSRGTFVQFPTVLIHDYPELGITDRWVLLVLMQVCWAEQGRLRKLSLGELSALTGVPKSLLGSTSQAAKKPKEGILERLERLHLIRREVRTPINAITGKPGRAQTYLTVEFAHIWQQNLAYYEATRSSQSHDLVDRETVLPVRQANDRTDQADDPVRQMDDVVRPTDTIVRQENDIVRPTDNPGPWMDNSVHPTNTLVRGTDDVVRGANTTVHPTNDNGRPTDNSVRPTNDIVRRARSNEGGNIINIRKIEKIEKTKEREKIPPAASSVVDQQDDHLVPSGEHTHTSSLSPLSSQAVAPPSLEKEVSPQPPPPVSEQEPAVALCAPKPVMPPDDAPWSVQTCMQLFDAWRGAPLLVSSTRRKAQQEAVGLVSHYSREQVVRVYQAMSADPYWAKQGGVDIEQVANHIARELKKLDQQSGRSPATSSSPSTASPPMDPYTARSLDKEYNARQLAKMRELLAQQQQQQAATTRVAERERRDGLFARHHPFSEGDPGHRKPDGTAVDLPDMRSARAASSS